MSYFDPANGYFQPYLKLTIQWSRKWPHVSWVDYLCFAWAHRLHGLRFNVGIVVCGLLIGLCGGKPRRQSE